MLHNVAETKRGCRVVYVSPLKALAVDVERNLRAPLAGSPGAPHGRRLPRPAPSRAHRRHARSASARAMPRQPADILITTPESLYLILTSQARETLAPSTPSSSTRSTRWSPTKRGAHLALSLERLAGAHGRGRCSASASRPRSARSRRSRASSAGGDRIAQPTARPRPRIRGRATVADLSTRSQAADRPVTIVNAPRRTAARTCAVETSAVEDMARLGALDEIAHEHAGVADTRRRLDLAADPSAPARAHPRRTSTILFVNSRRLAERLAGALNETAGEEHRARAPRLASRASSAPRSRSG